MCLPWNHKWETISKKVTPVYGSVLKNIQIADLMTETQRCTHCGKEIVRKYRV